MAKKWKIGVLGGIRGKYVLRCEPGLSDRMEVTALCETNKEALDNLRSENLLPDRITIYDDFDAFLKSGIDAVVLCNYFHEHTPLAIKAMKAGIPVLSETTAAPTLGHCVELVEAYEETGTKYMLGANCLYWRVVQAMRKAVADGKYGKVVFGDAEYIHPGNKPETPEDIDENNLHWRKTLPRGYYNMHDLGPLMYIANEMPKRVIGKAVVTADPKKQLVNFDKFFGLVEMESGAVFNYSGCTGAGSMSKWYRVACKDGTVESVRYDQKETKLLECVSHGEPELHDLSWVDSGALTAEEEAKYMTPEVMAATHDGIDVVLLLNFLKYLDGDAYPFYDVYRAVALSACGILSWYSALSDSKPMDIPDFRDKAQRDAVRNDYRMPFAKRLQDQTLPSMAGAEFTR